MNKAVNPIRNGIAVLVTILLCMMLCMGAFCETVSADQKEPLSFSFDQTKVKAGDTVTGTLDANQSDITNGMITITYDKNLELIRAEKSAQQADDTYVSINAKTTGTVVIAFSAMKPVKNGPLVDLEFKASGSAKGGSTLKISGETPEVYDSANNPVKIAALGQSFQVSGTSGGSSGSDTGDNAGTKGDDTAKKPGQNADKKSDQNSKTGDEQPVMLYLVIGAAAMAGIVYLIRKEAVKKHENK